MEPGQRRYLRELKLLLPIYGDERKRVVRQIAEELAIDYYEKKEDILTYEKLCEWHGKPREIVKNYLQNLDAEQLMPHIRLSLIRNRIFMVAVVVVLGVFIFLNIFLWHGWQKSQEEITIDYVDDILEGEKTNEEKVGSGFMFCNVIGSCTSFCK